MALLALMLTACGNTAPGERVLGDPPSKIGLVEVSKASNLVFPADAALLAGWYSYFQDWHLAARVRVPASELAAFRADNAVPEPVPATGSFANPASDADDGWRPAPATAADPSDVDGVARRLRFVADGDGVVVHVLAAAAQP